MKVEQFIAVVLAEMDDFVEQKEPVAAETPLRSLAGWSSMASLLLVSRMDELFHIAISAEELSEVITIRDLWDLVQAKTG